LLSVFLLENRPVRESCKEPAVGAFEPRRAIAKYLRMDLIEIRSEFPVFKMMIFLVHGRESTGKSKRFPAQGAEIAVFRHLCVVNDLAAAHPLRERASVLPSGST